MRRRRRHGVEAEIPTASTGDIAFLLIIFFMVTASFAVTKGLHFDLPSRQEPPDGNHGEDSVLIEIRNDGAIVVDCRPMEPDAILDYLEPRLARNPTKPVILYAHAGARYEHLVRAYEALAHAGERGFAGPNVQIPTPDVIDGYVRAFGADPFEAHCDG